MSRATTKRSSSLREAGRLAVWAGMGAVLGLLALRAVAAGAGETGAGGGAEGAAAAPADDAATRAEAERLQQQGFELQKARKTTEALEKYEAALRIDPDHVATLYEIGWSYYVLGRWEEVVRVWERVLELAPEHADAAKYLPEARGNRDLLRRAERAGAQEEAGGAARGGGATGGGTTGADTSPATGAGGPALLRIAAGGDTMLGSPTTKSGLPKDPGALLAPWKPLLEQADLAFLNYEGTFLDAGESDKCRPDSDVPCYAFRSPVRFVRHLVDAGIDVVTVANNHSNDFDEAGRASTASALRAAKLGVTGFVGQTALVERQGLKVGVIGFSTSVGHHSLKDIRLAALAVRELDTEADVVVVTFHGGAEGKDALHVPAMGVREDFFGEDRGDLRAFARAVVDAGADLVVGHGPHVLRGMEIYRERLIAYSMGNFVVWGGFNLAEPNCLTGLLLADLHADGRFAGGRFVAGRQPWPGGALPDPDGAATRLLRELSLADFGDAAVRVGDDGSLAAAPPQRGQD